MDFEYTGDLVSTLKIAAESEIEDGISILINTLNEYKSFGISDEAARGEILKMAICIDLLDKKENASFEIAEELYNSGKANGSVFTSIQDALNKIR